MVFSGLWSSWVRISSATPSYCIVVVVSADVIDDTITIIVYIVSTNIFGSRISFRQRIIAIFSSAIGAGISISI